jgi:eukaryotic-like serine/threonine-protein kinase
MGGDDDATAVGPIATLTLAPAPSPAPAAAGRPDRIAHFVIERQLGAGGMGVVYAAYDSDLDRPVAIKLVRDRAASSSSGRWLIREAQAMAKLSHPNVVAVYEVGTLGDQLFVVMELVDGEDLHLWLKTRRAWRAVVALFVEAGAGLAAAHAAGIVHRDFKPSNVLVDHAGRPRVCDFGIARFAGPVDESARTAIAGDASTDTTVAGTPAYMAPEQWDGVADARSDQYAFGVTLHEAVYGVRPGQAGPTAAGATDRELVPRRIARAIRKAMAPAAADRFADMPALLAELRAGLGARRRVAIAAGVVLAMSGSAAAAVALAPSGGGADPCDGPVVVDELWSPAAQAAIAARASDATARTATVIAGEWRDAWKSTRQVACRGEPTLRPRRLACLDRQAIQLGALADVWSDPAITPTIEGARELPPAGACLAPPAGVAPVSPEERAALVDADRAVALVRAGEPDRARAALARIDVGAADRSDDVAERVATARVYLAADAGELAAAAALVADRLRRSGRTGSSSRTVEALVMRSLVLADLGRTGEAREAIAAGALVAELGDVDDFATALAIARAKIELLDDDLVAARADLAPIVARDPATLGTADRLDHAFACELDAGIDIALDTPAGGQRALATLARARAVYAPELGDAHPKLAQLDVGRAQAARLAGRTAEAKELLARGRAGLVAAYGEDHPLVAKTTAEAARVAYADGDLDRAEALARDAGARLRQVLPDDHADFMAIDLLLGDVARARGDAAGARAHYAAAHRLAVDPDDPAVGRLGLARALAGETGADVEGMLGAFLVATARDPEVDPGDLVAPLVGLGWIADARRERDRARALVAAAEADAAAAVRALDPAVRAMLDRLVARIRAGR